MFDFNEIARGYTDEQYTRACITTIVCYLSEKGIIEMKDVNSYLKENLTNNLKEIVENDREEVKKRVDELRKKDD